VVGNVVPANIKSDAKNACHENPKNKLTEMSIVKEQPIRLYNLFQVPPAIQRKAEIGSEK
jgi:hypothetical protein